MIPGRVGAATLPTTHFRFAAGLALSATRVLAAALSFSGWRTFAFGLAQPAL